MKNNLVSLFIFLLAASTLSGQEAGRGEGIYKINPWISASFGVAGSTANFIGIRNIRAKDDIPEAIVLALDKSSVNRFDRPALFLDPANRKSANTISDVAQYLTFVSPLLLLTDRRIKSHWLDIGVLYFETQTIATLIYAWSPLGPKFIDRYRPESYYTELSLSNRRSGQNRNSFFSGHGITTATASFFMAKVIDDHHPELGGKKWLVYGAALVPPAVVGYFRVKSLRHFPSDVLAATALGAAIGVLVPQLHKRKNANLSIGSNAEGNGMALVWRF